MSEQIAETMTQAVTHQPPAAPSAHASMNWFDESRVSSLKEENDRLRSDVDRLHRERESQENAREQERVRDIRDTLGEYQKNLDEAAKNDDGFKDIMHRVTVQADPDLAYFVQKYAGKSAPQVMKEYASKGELAKLSQQLRDDGVHHQARFDIIDLARSIGLKEEAKKLLPQKDVPAPLTQMPNNGTTSNTLSVSDYRKKIRSR